MTESKRVTLDHHGPTSEAPAPGVVLRTVRGGRELQTLVEAEPDRKSR